MRTMKFALIAFLATTFFAACSSSNGETSAVSDTTVSEKITVLDTVNRYQYFTLDDNVTISYSAGYANVETTDGTDPGYGGTPTYKVWNNVEHYDNTDTFTNAEGTGSRYATMRREKRKEDGTVVLLVNTGYDGGEGGMYTTEDIYFTYNYQTKEAKGITSNYDRNAKIIRKMLKGLDNAFEHFDITD